ncbi:hypothetical protein CENSYa_0528 [Cenarchaeum symbiosum A]|uniref:Uncharacterized protein n=1 Tax=Cenarchaeum symbiosum (strain A) TaxID=414004 RepID=A0RUZ4_CENSY|nr:hypothetical protein CENSYa_0528 [Cenarchaeum symbiosum A]
MSKQTYGIALGGSAAVLALLALVPAGTSFLPGGAADPAFYGMAELVHTSADGELLSSHTVHNRLVDTGEEILIYGAFGDLADSKKPTLLCVSDVDHTDTFPADDSLVALHVPSNAFANTSVNTCVTADINTTISSVAIMNATFTPDTNYAFGEVINSITVCNTNMNNSNMQNCVNAGDIFSTVETPQTNATSADDLIGVTYTFNVTSPEN